MSSVVKEINASFINLKLKFLEKQRDRLQDFCRDVNKVLSDGRAWVNDNEGSHFSYDDMSRRIEDMILLLSSQGYSASDDTESRQSTLQEQREPVEGASDGLAETQQQPSTLTENLTRDGSIHQTDHSTMRHDTVPGYVKQILSRLDVVDVAFSSLKTSTEKISETQTEVQTQIENIKQNQSQVGEQQTKQLADIEKKVKKMGKHTEGIKQQERKVTNLEKEMEAVKEREKKVTALESEIQTMKKQEKKMNSLQNEMVAVTSQLHDLEEKTFRKIRNVEKQGEINADMIYHVKSRTESLSA